MTKFSPYSKPSLCVKKPEKILTERKEVCREGVSCGDRINFIPGTVCYLEKEYEMYQDEQSCYVVYYEEGERENPNYEKELGKYEKAKATHLKELKEWNKQKKIYDQKEKENKEVSERKLLETLKKKYENI
jgi:hypothetical protein